MHHSTALVICKRYSQTTFALASLAVPMLTRMDARTLGEMVPGG
jgi:hypothetical protein